MEKEIKLVLTEDKDIDIYVNNKLKLKIQRDKREINAEAIYNIFDYKRGDRYNIVTENIPNNDIPVLEFLKSLFIEINKGIENEIVKEHEEL